MVSHNTPQTAWGSMINHAGKALKYTVYGTLTVGLALFGLDAGAHLFDYTKATITSTPIDSMSHDAANAVKSGIQSVWDVLEKTYLSIFGGATYPDGAEETFTNIQDVSTKVEDWAAAVHNGIDDSLHFLFDHKTEVGVGAAGAVGGGILTAASMKQSHADRIQQERMKLAAAEAFQRG